MFIVVTKALLPLSRPHLLHRPLQASTHLLPALTLHSHLPATSRSRPFSHSPFLAHPRKDSQDKDSIQPEATEYSKSGTDDGAARQEEAAFDPDKTSPEEQKDTAGEGNDGSNPLEVSPANPEVSQQRGATEGGAENSAESSSDSGSDRKRSSGGGSPSKGKKVG